MNLQKSILIVFAVLVCLNPFISKISSYVRTKLGYGPKTETGFDTLKNATSAEVQCFDPNTWVASSEIPKALKNYAQNLTSKLNQLRLETENIIDTINNDPLWASSTNNKDFNNLIDHYWGIFKQVKDKIGKEVQINQRDINLRGLRCIQFNTTYFSGLNEADQHASNVFAQYTPFLWNFTVATYKNDPSTAIYYLLEYFTSWPEIQKACLLYDDHEYPIELEYKVLNSEKCAGSMKSLANKFAAFGEDMKLLMPYRNRVLVAKMVQSTINNCIRTRSNDESNS